mmetsp:Transcript_53030/g.105230  ORF Transcript_53030/g.105230 Transcript_53030/m.105230 type:complete len:218 (-) Transcript_53030:124-777(-)
MISQVLQLGIYLKFASWVRAICSAFSLQGVLALLSLPAGLVWLFRVNMTCALQLSSRSVLLFSHHCSQEHIPPPRPTPRCHHQSAKRRWRRLASAALFLSFASWALLSFSASSATLRSLPWSTLETLRRTTPRSDSSSAPNRRSSASCSALAVSAFDRAFAFNSAAAASPALRLAWDSSFTFLASWLCALFSAPRLTHWAAAALRCALARSRADSIL